MSFVPYKQWAEQDTETYIIGNSQTLNLYDPVLFPLAAGLGGYVWPAAVTSTSALVYGVVVGFVASPGGSSQQNLQANQVVAASNNQTVNQYRARILPARQSRLFIADLSQTAGTTSGSGDPGFFSLGVQQATPTGVTLTETSYVVATGTASTFFSIGSGTSNSSTSGAGYSNNGNVGLFPASQSQVVGYFSNSKTF